MTQINAYLHFNGNCREAMMFYQTCLGGELTLMPIGESALADQMPGHLSQHILHAALKRDGLVLLASDLGVSMGETTAIGHAVSLMLDCSSEAELTTLFAKLSAGGRVLHPLENTFWGATFGDLTDPYGFHWYLSFDQNQPA